MAFWRLRVGRLVEVLQRPSASRPGPEPGSIRRVISCSALWLTHFVTCNARGYGSRLRAGTTRGEIVRLPIENA
jgi:hypothetical protein